MLIIGFRQQTTEMQSRVILASFQRLDPNGDGGSEARWSFQARHGHRRVRLVASRKGSGPLVGADQLIKTASGQLANAFRHGPRLPLQWLASQIDSTL
jgi:hypothetical protein